MCRYIYALGLTSTTNRETQREQETVNVNGDPPFVVFPEGLDKSLDGPEQRASPTTITSIV